MKKKTQNPVEHEEQYIKYLEKQINYYIKLNKLPNKIGDYIQCIEDLKYKLSKARLVLKLLKSR